MCKRHCSAARAVGLSDNRGDRAESLRADSISRRKHDFYARGLMAMLVVGISALLTQTTILRWGDVVLVGRMSGGGHPQMIDPRG